MNELHSTSEISQESNRSLYIFSSFQESNTKCKYVLLSFRQKELTLTRNGYQKIAAAVDVLVLATCIVLKPNKERECGAISHSCEKGRSCESRKCCRCSNSLETLSCASDLDEDGSRFLPKLRLPCNLRQITPLGCVIYGSFLTNVCALPSL